MTTFELPLRIGARRSPLAQIQAKLVSDRLRTIHGLLGEEGAVETVLIQTEGDAVRDRPLSEIGGKGLFTKEIDRALINGRIDVAVHSMKDVPTVLPESLTIPCLLPREDPRDAWISFSGLSMAALPAGASVGTSSLRRQAQILARRPDLHVEPLRGNVDTRLKKLNLGEVDATLLAYAGLKRLGQEDVITEILSSDEMLPAIAQGAIGAQCRRTDDQVLGFLMPLNHSPTEIAVQAERAFLARLDGSCETPIAALCTLDGEGGLHLSGLMATSDGTEVIEGKIEGVHADGRKLGEELGARLLARAGPNFLMRKK